jgi:membrane protease YdiL (CAAX protease family)
LFARDAQPLIRSRDLAAIVGLLIAVNVASRLPLSPWAYGSLQLIAAVVAVVGAVWRGYSLEALGLAPRDAAAGARIGGAVSLAVIAGVALIASIPATQTFFSDDRFADLSTGDAVVEIAVRIPLVTALTEELLFRSVLLAVLLELVSRTGAIVVSSLLFGLWHVLITTGDLQGNEVTGDLPVLGSIATVAAVVAVTAAAGAVFAWLRLRSGSAVAPWLVHTTLNAASFTAGFALAS